MEKYWRRRERQVKTRKFSNEFPDFGGGGGSRTRVRKHVVVGLYMRVRICFLVPGVRMRPKPPGTSLGKSRGHAPRRRAATSLFNGVRPSTTRRGQGERHSLIKLRERTDCPQLTDVPSDLRVNGARHASRNLMPPSKPISPPQGESLTHRTLLRCVLSMLQGSSAWRVYKARPALRPKPIVKTPDPSASFSRFRPSGRNR